MEDVKYGYIPVYREAEKSAKVFSLFFVFLPFPVINISSVLFNVMWNSSLSWTSSTS